MWECDHSQPGKANSRAELSCLQTRVSWSASRHAVVYRLSARVLLPTAFSLQISGRFSLSEAGKFILGFTFHPPRVLWPVYVYAHAPLSKVAQVGIRQPTQLPPVNCRPFQRILQVPDSPSLGLVGIAALIDDWPKRLSNRSEGLPLCETNAAMSFNFVLMPLDGQRRSQKKGHFNPISSFFPISPIWHYYFHRYSHRKSGESERRRDSCLFFWKPQPEQLSRWVMIISPLLMAIPLQLFEPLRGREAHPPHPHPHPRWKPTLLTIHQAFQPSTSNLQPSLLSP